jgi:uncharacterized membrane protein YbhN (UPF0104 family)
VASIVTAVTTPTDPPVQTEGKSKRLIGPVGITIGLVGLAFAFYALAKGWDEIARAMIVPHTLVAAGVVGIAGMATIGLNWIRIIRSSGVSVEASEGMRWYFVGQLGKYIPGGLWAVLGRGELATRGGVVRTISYTSVGVSMATTYAAAATVGALLLAFGASSLASLFAWMALSAATVVAAVLGLSEPVVRRGNRLASRLGRKIELPSTTPGMSLTAILTTMPAWLCIGSATALAGNALGFSMDVAQVIAATSYSWLAGFLVVPMPGGLGVREAAFIALYPGPTEEAAAIAVVARIVFILVDLAGAATATFVARLALRRRR